MKNEEELQMENNFDNIPNEQETPQQEQNTNTSNTGSDSQQYTDPNAGMNAGYTQSYYGGGSAGYQQTGQSQNYGNTSYQQQYQDNYNYNVGSNTGYNQGYEEGMDNSPLSMGEWVLTLLLMSIPCVNIIMCCVWAFGKNGNVNRRNFCRAELIFIAIGLVLSVIMIFVVMAMMAGTGYYYY